MSYWTPKPEECERLEAVYRQPWRIELAALRRRCGRLRYRIVDRAAQVLGKIPLLPGIMWFTRGRDYSSSSKEVRRWLMAVWP